MKKIKLLQLCFLLFALTSFSAIKAQTSGIQACVINGFGQPGPLQNSTTGYVLTILGNNSVGWAPGGGGGGGGWNLTGNSGTTPGTNFIGTTDGKALQIKINDTLTGWIDYTLPRNTFLGYKAGFDNGTGVDNTYIGCFSWEDNGGSANTAIGAWSGFLAGGSYTTFVGDSAGYNAVSSMGSTFVGYAAGLKTTTGSFNSGVGYKVLRNNITGSFNTAMGYNAVLSNTSGMDNIGFGQASIYSNTTGSFNIGIGVQADSLGNGSYNIGIGYQAASGNLGNYDVFIGYQSGQLAGNENYCTAVGYLSMPNNTSGFSAAFGDYSLNSANGSSLNNTAMGHGGLYLTTSGTDNTGVGYFAGEHNTTGIQNTYLGSTADCNAGSYSNSTAIGYGASITASNLLVLGNTSVTQTQFSGALMPFYSASYQPGTSGQVLTSQGSGVAPQWKASTASILKSQSVAITSTGQNFSCTNGIGILSIHITVSGAGSSIGVITLPSSPVDGQEVNISSPATLSLVLGTNFSPVPVASSSETGATGTFIQLVWNSTDGVWYVTQ